MASEMNAVTPNMTIGAKYTPADVPIKTSSNSPSESVASITNTKELKQAELQGKQVPLRDEQLIKAIEKAVKSMQGPYTYLEFSIHETTKQIAVSVHDRETGEVIREIPPEKMLDFVAKLWEMAGILVDERR
ncbi:flagellar protein FlaG [Paenibacillus alkalitolerans]|uniref:flagellar protein FlaG n=1 Tax=Paenibacillus alkalitolerans TaxID=2799335 RepID=UPI001F37745D|nr:flagellar protein FlaG [Paenibacillus alkalitolerans]